MTGSGGSDMVVNSMLPPGWRNSRLRFALDFPRKSEVSCLPESTVVSFVPMEAIGERGGLTLGQERELGEVQNGYSFFSDGDVIVAKITPCFENGKGAIARGLRGGVGFGTTELHCLRGRAGMLPEYLFYLTCTHQFRRLGEGWMYGAGGQKRVPESFIKDLVHPIPPNDEQRAIVAFLDRETARIDELIAKKERLIELLAARKRAEITQRVLCGFAPGVPLRKAGLDCLGSVPSHWASPPLYARYSVALGKMLDARQVTGAFLLPYLRNVDVQWDRINASDLPQMDISPEEYERFLLKKGDLLVCEGGEVGRCAVWEGALEPCAYQKALHRLRPLGTEECVRYMFYTLAHVAASGYFAASGSPNTIPHLTAEKLRVFRFPKPPLEEQIQIADRLDAYIDLQVRTEKATSVAVDRLREYRTALISAAVTGQIDVQTYRKEPEEILEGV